MRQIKWRPTKLITLMAASVLIQMLLFGSALAGAQSQPLSGAAQDATEFTSLVSHQNAAPEDGTFRGFYGEVAAGGANITGNVGAINLNLLYSDEQEKLTFTESQWGPNNKLELPAGTGKSDLADFLAPGSQVAVLAQLVNGEWTAVQLMPAPESPVAPPTTGLVVGSNAADGTFTIVTSTGESFDLQLSPGVPAPAQGEIAAVFRERRTGVSGQPNGEKPQRVPGGGAGQRNKSAFAGSSPAVDGDRRPIAGR